MKAVEAPSEYPSDHEINPTTIKMSIRWFILNSLIIYFLPLSEPKRVNWFEVKFYVFLIVVFVPLIVVIGLWNKRPRKFRLIFSAWTTHWIAAGIYILMVQKGVVETPISTSGRAETRDHFGSIFFFFCMPATLMTYIFSASFFDFLREDRRRPMPGTVPPGAPKTKKRP